MFVSELTAEHCDWVTARLFAPYKILLLTYLI